MTIEHEKCSNFMHQALREKGKWEELEAGVVPRPSAASWVAPDNTAGQLFVIKTYIIKVKLKIIN